MDSNNTFLFQRLFHPALWCFVIGVCLAPTDVKAFSRAYVNYEVVSDNHRFVALVNYRDPGGKPKVKVYEVLNNERRFRWEATLFAPIEESILLANDGGSLVLENYHPYTDNALYFYHEGRLVQVYKVDAVTPPSDDDPAFRVHGVMPGGNLKWGAKFSFLSTAGSEPCYCAWYAGETNWMAWRLKDGERIVDDAKQQATWNEEATRIATLIVDDQPPGSFQEPRTVNPASQGLLPGVGKESSLRFLTREKTLAARAILTTLLSSPKYSLASTGTTLDIVEFEAGSRERALAERFLADFDRPSGPPGEHPNAGVEKLHLGGLRGVVELNAIPKGGTIIMAVVPMTAGPGWPKQLPVEWIAADLREVHRSMPDLIAPKKFKPSARLGFTFSDLAPDEYQVKVLWQPRGKGLPDASAVKPLPGDFLGESEVVTIHPGVVFEPELFKCDRKLVP